MWWLIVLGLFALSAILLWWTITRAKRASKLKAKLKNWDNLSDEEKNQIIEQAKEAQAKRVLGKRGKILRGIGWGAGPFCFVLGLIVWYANETAGVFISVAGIIWLLIWFLIYSAWIGARAGEVIGSAMHNVEKLSKKVEELSEKFERDSEKRQNQKEER